MRCKVLIMTVLVSCLSVNIVHGIYCRCFIPLFLYFYYMFYADLFIPIEKLNPCFHRCSISFAQCEFNEMLKQGKMIKGSKCVVQFAFICLFCTLLKI